MNNTTISNTDSNLIKKLEKAQEYVIKRYEYYNDEVKANYDDSSLKLDVVNCDAIKITIDAIRNKLLISHMINAKNFEQYFTTNFMNKIVKSCLISGCAFARIYRDKNGNIELIPYDAYFATGILDNDNTLKSAVTVEDTDDKGKPLITTFYSEKETVTKYSSKKKDVVTPNTLETIHIVPIIINQNALKPFGSSYITKKMMSDTKMLRKAKKRAEKVQETLTQANTFLLGVAQDLKQDLDPHTLELLENVITITQDANQQSPTVVTRENGGNQLEQKIKDLETSIKYDETGVAYLDMIEAIREDIIEGINNVANVMIKVIKGDKKAKINGRIDIVFKNNDFSNFSPFMDGVLKVNQVIPGYLAKEQMDKILGINGNKSKLAEALKEDVKSGMETDVEVEELQNIKSSGQKMYATTSILQKYKRSSISTKTAIKMLKMVGWTEEEANGLLEDEAGE